MVYVDKNLNISVCFFCKTQNKLNCDCKKINVSVSETKIYSIKDINNLKNTKWLQEYEASKAIVVKELKTKFPQAKKFKIYPHIAKLLPLN